MPSSAARTQQRLPHRQTCLSDGGRLSALASPARMTRVSRRIRLTRAVLVLGMSLLAFRARLVVVICSTRAGRRGRSSTASRAEGRSPRWSSPLPARCPMFEADRR